MTAKATRRPRGAPRLLLLDAARTLFARQDYRSTTTKEIAETAGVLEHLLFRNFGSKAALFHEAVVLPFVQIVDELNSGWESLEPGPENSEAQAIAGGSPPQSGTSGRIVPARTSSMAPSPVTTR